MVFFTSSAERERHASTEKTLEATHSVLTDAVLSEAMPKTQRTLIDMLNLVYIANVSDGIVTKPKSIKDPDAIPAVSFRKDEALRVEPSIWSMLPFQENAYMEYLVSQGVEDSPEQTEAEILAVRTLFKNRFDTPSEISIPKKSKAMLMRPRVAVRIQSQTLGTAIDRRFEGRPLMGFRMIDDLDAHPGIIGLHESVHLAQTFQQTSSENTTEAVKRLSFERELQAYYYQVVAIQALYHHSNNPDLRHNQLLFSGNALAIEELRAQENKDRLNPFEPTDALRTKLSEIGIDI